MIAGADCREAAEAVKLECTSHKERKNRISISRRGDECVEFYRLDSEPVRECLARKRPGGKQGLKLCDIVVRYRETSQATSSTVVFAELKGGDIPRAFKQLDESVRRVRDRLDELWPESAPKRWRAVIVCSGSAPSQTSNLKTKFRREWGFEPVLHSKKCDVRDLLR
jgi:hypothetical protein